MTDKEYNQLRRKILKLSNKWRDILGLQGYRIRHHWHREHHPENRDIGAETKMRWAYIEADFDWYMPQLSTLNLDDTELEEVIVHEFCHVLVDPLMHEDTEHGKMVFERVVSTIQRAILFVYKEEAQDVKTTK